MAATPVIDGNLQPLGYVQISVTSVSGLTNIPKGARLALIQAEGDAVRWRDDGPNPTSSVGIRLLEDRDIYYTGDLYTFKALNEVGNGKLNVSYYGTPDGQVL